MQLILSYKKSGPWLQNALAAVCWSIGSVSACHGVQRVSYSALNWQPLATGNWRSPPPAPPRAQCPVSIGQAQAPATTAPKPEGLEARSVLELVARRRRSQTETPSIDTPCLTAWHLASEPEDASLRGTWRGPGSAAPLRLSPWSVAPLLFGCWISAVCVWCLVLISSLASPVHRASPTSATLASNYTDCSCRCTVSPSHHPCLFDFQRFPTVNLPPAPVDGPQPLAQRRRPLRGSPLWSGKRF
jgi:hypothetical protein